MKTKTNCTPENRNSTMQTHQQMCILELFGKSVKGKRKNWEFGGLSCWDFGYPKIQSHDKFVFTSVFGEFLSYCFIVRLLNQTVKSWTWKYTFCAIVFYLSSSFPLFWQIVVDFVLLFSIWRQPCNLQCVLPNILWFRIDSLAADFLLRFSGFRG